MKIFKTFGVTVAAILLTSGAYRHDKNIEQHLQLGIDPAYNCVGEVLHLKDGNWLPDGSFVLIDSVHLLTAAHVLAAERKKDTIINYQGMKIQTYIVTGRYLRKPAEFSFHVMNQWVKAKRLVCHPLYLQYNTCDLAIVTLEKPVKGAPRVLLNTLADEINDTVTVVGFGSTGKGNDFRDTYKYHARLAGKNIIDSIGGILINGLGSTLHADFDMPQGQAACNKTGSPLPLELEYGVLGGDSGGGLFRTRNNRLQLLGITCGGGSSISEMNDHGYYCKIDSWTRIAAFNTWINANK